MIETREYEADSGETFNEIVVYDLDWWDLFTGLSPQGMRIRVYKNWKGEPCAAIYILQENKTLEYIVSPTDLTKLIFWLNSVVKTENSVDSQRA